MRNSQAGRLGYITIYSSDKQRVVRHVPPQEAMDLEAQGKIGWFTRKGKERAYIKPFPSSDRFRL